MLILGLGALSTLWAQGEAQKKDQQQSVKPAIQQQPFSWTQLSAWRNLPFLKWLETLPGLPPHVELRLREKNGFTVLTIGPAAPPSTAKLNCKPGETPVRVYCASPDVPPQPLGECCMDEQGHGCDELIRQCINKGGCANVCPLRLIVPVGSSALTQLEASYYAPRLLSAIQTLPLQPLEQIEVTFHLTPSGYVQTDSVELWLLPQEKQPPRPASWHVHGGYYFPYTPRDQREFFELHKKGGPKTCNTWSECEKWAPIPGYTFILIASYWPEEEASSGARPRSCRPLQEKEPHIAVSPAGELSLDLPEWGTWLLQVWDMHGQLRQSFSVEGSQASLPLTLPAGVYHLQLLAPSGAKYLRTVAFPIAP